MIDAPTPPLGRLLSTADLGELCDRLGPPLRAVLVVEDSTGARLVGVAPGVTAVTRDVVCAGDVVGRVVATGPGAEAAAAALVAAVEIAAHHAYATALAAHTHAAAMALNFAALTLQNSELAASVTRLEQADRARSSFLAMMSHELRTPLTSVMGYADLLLEGLAGPVTAEQREHLRTILSKAEQLLSVIGALLDVARASSAGGAREVVALAPLVREVVGSQAESIARRGLRVQIAATPLMVQGDRRQLRQLLTNLVNNALKFSYDAGEVEIVVVAGPLAASDASDASDADAPRGQLDAAHVIVRDHGIGISAEAMAQVFEPFYQADSSSTRAHGGSGIGLTVARAFAQAHGGRIWVDSELGRGATFVVTLPLSTAAEVKSHAANPPTALPERS